MKIAVLKETYPSERRVALVPANVAHLVKAGWEVAVECGAGAAAGYLDDDYRNKGATVVADRSTLLKYDILLYVRAVGSNPEQGRADLSHYDSQIVIGMCDPLGASQAIADVADTGASLFALELIPRITRAQSMDVLSSMATVAGYRAVLLASVELPKMFPLLMTAAGTVAAARVLVIGAGVAGLQAIATARRLGGIVQAYDVRAATREQIESLGGKFVELDLDTGESEDKGGYAKALGEEFYQRQRELLADVVAECDVVITTAAIPGKPSPVLVTEEGVKRMPAGSVIVDLAAERGGNCPLSQPDQRVVEHDVVILGPTNLPSDVPFHASQMFSNNVTKLLLNMVDKERPGELQLDFSDEIVQDTLVAHGGEVRSPRIREALGMEPLESASDDNDADSDDEIKIDEDQSGDSGDTIKVDVYADNQPEQDSGGDDSSGDAQTADSGGEAAGGEVAEADGAPTHNPEEDPA
ncbi:MAG: Re/Si-specific NAD(P)(+) transhydrogenase subunit alpha [Pirellulaceae bacterium]|jgi:NAD(P) transhydrogenase subunit alpha|nr:Re/Si-specific NAD(P)(+) transhydrogenase subunit alpha [Pirellulaceae bacterium]